MREIDSRVVRMPFVDLRLKVVAYLEQLSIDWRKFIDDGLEAAPECRGLEFNRWQKLFFNKLEEDRVDVQPAHVVTCAFLCVLLVLQLRRSRPVFRQGLYHATNCSSSVLPASAVVEDKPSMIVF